MEPRHVFWEVVEGRRPYGPDAQILGARIVEAVPGSGHITVEFDGQAFPTQVLGHVSGGFIAAMLDYTASRAPATTFEPNEYGPSLELKVNFIRAAHVGKFRAIGRTLHRTTSIAFTEAKLRNRSGRAHRHRVFDASHHSSVSAGLTRQCSGRGNSGGVQHGGLVAVWSQCGPRRWA